MTKESEAVEKLKNYFLNKQPLSLYQGEKLVNIIEIAIKEFERLNKEYSIVVNEKIELCSKYAKDHEVLRIIKEIIPISFKYDTVEKSYYIVINNIGYECNKEEYDLLKKVLL